MQGTSKKKRLSYTVSKKDIALITLMIKLGSKHNLVPGMKVRATHLNPPIWFYGTIRGLSLSRRGSKIFIKVEKTAPEIFKQIEGALYPLVLSFTEGISWVEPYDY